MFVLLFYTKKEFYLNPIASRPSDKAQRKELRLVMQQEFRGMLQKRMDLLLQV